MCLLTVTHLDMYALVPAYMYKFTPFFACLLAFLIETPVPVLSMSQHIPIAMYLCMHFHASQQSFAYKDTFRGLIERFSIFSLCHVYTFSGAESWWEKVSSLKIPSGAMVPGAMNRSMWSWLHWLHLIL